VDYSWPAWFVSVAAVVSSGIVAWFEGAWVRRSGLDMGFANHGGMWGDLLLLPIANAAIVPHLGAGLWLAGALVVSAVASAWAHRHWYRGASLRADTSPPIRSRTHAGEHMWPSRPHGTWYRDLSGAGWLHVVYVTGQLTLLIGFLLYPMPTATVALVAAIFTVHVPIGLLQPRWFLTRHIASLRQQPLLVPCLAMLWIVATVKLFYAHPV